MMANITFLSFLLFSMCHSIHVAVNTWLNCSFFTLIFAYRLTSSLYTAVKLSVTVVLQVGGGRGFHPAVFRSTPSYRVQIYTVIPWGFSANPHFISNSFIITR